MGGGGGDFASAFCPEPFSNHYKKSIAFTSFPRLSPLTSNAGQLHNVEQHLPLLLGSNLRNRHGMLTPLFVNQSLSLGGLGSGLDDAAQAQLLARQNRVQYFVSGEINDMGMKSPQSMQGPNGLTRFISGTHDALGVKTPLDKRSRIFSFTLRVHDGITGQVVSTTNYQTYGLWQAGPEEAIGFDSPRFWQTDYGRQVQGLVAKASDQLAGVMNCEPFMARVDAKPYQQSVVIQGGTNNGLRTGDALDLYQLVYEPLTGEYQKYDTRVVKRDVRVYLTEVYPSHSVGHVTDNALLNGQYMVKGI
jgi:hypothetical protein